jgi:hypothetical protein
MHQRVLASTVTAGFVRVVSLAADLPGCARQVLAPFDSELLGTVLCDGRTLLLVSGTTPDPLEGASL